MMFKNQILTFIILFLFTSPVFSNGGVPVAGNDPCCPEDNNLLPAQGGERIAPLQNMPARDIPRVHSLAEPDAVIVPGLAAQALPNVADMIAGRVAGVLVMGGGGWNNYIVRIRGAMGPPLLVIDEMPFYQARDDESFNALLQTIPTAEVASIEVLKNIARTAIYGGHGANGVIRVNTRGYVQMEE